MDAVIYTRVSHENRSVSVQDQERECRAVCETKGWPVRAVFCDDGISASRYGKDRPAWAALKAELRQGDILVVWEASRAHRDLEEFVALRNLCAELDVPLSYAGRILDLSKGDDRFVGGLDALVAERESEQIKERVLRGKRAAAAEGWPSTRPPWGYLATRQADATGRLRPQWEPDPIEAPRLREAVERLLAGDTTYSVMKWIEATEGVTPSSLTNLKRALINPALAGLRVHQRQVVGKGTWAPIITEEQHRKLVRELNRASRTTGYTSPPGPEPKYLLTGIAKCVKCGEGLRWKNWGDTRNPSYICYRGHCCRVAHQMNATVEKALFGLIPFVILAAKVGGYEPADNAVAEDDAIRQIEELEQSLEEWTQAAIRREVTPAAFAKIEKGLLMQIETLEPKSPHRLDLQDAEGIEAWWPTMSMRERREQVRTFLTVTVVPAERRGARTGNLIIEPGGDAIGNRDGTILSYLSYRVSPEGDRPAGWVLRTPFGDELDLADAATATALAQRYREMSEGA